METRKIRTPSARMLAAKQDDGPSPKMAAAIGTSGLPKLDQQQHFVRKIDSQPSSSSSSQILRQAPPTSSTPSRHIAKPRPQTPIHDDEIDIHTSTVDMDHHSEDVDDVDDVEEDMEMQMGKPEKLQDMVMNGEDFSVANEVVISQMKYRPAPPRKSEAARPSSFASGESLCLKTSDLSLPNKAAHFLYFRCYDEHEVQKEFPLTIDEQRKGPQNFLVEPRVGLKNTDYYIDSYLWNRGKSTSSKKKIFVSIENNHVKTSRRGGNDCHYMLNWYYSNMENRICKKVCWLETLNDQVRASPVLVQYLVNYVCPQPIELRKTPKLYSDTRSVAQELLRSDSPLETVQRFVETGETDPREVINKKQAYEMRRYVMANARKRFAQRKFEDMYFDDEMLDEIHYNEYGEPVMRRNPQTEVGRAAHLAVRMEGRRLENRIARILDARLPVPKNHAQLLNNWIQNLEEANPDTVHLVINDVVGSMKRHLDEMMGGPDASEYMHHDEHEDVEEGGASTSNPTKRMKMMVGVEDEDEVEVDHVVEEEVDGEGNVLARRTAAGGPKRFEGERYIFDGQEYVEEEVITEEIEVVPPAQESEEGGVAGGGDVPGEVFFRGSSSPSTSGAPKPVEEEHEEH